MHPPTTEPKTKANQALTKLPPDVPITTVPCTAQLDVSWTSLDE